MKILYFTNSRIPTEKAHGIQIMKTCEALVKSGADLKLILPFRKNKPFKRIDTFDYYQIKLNFKIKKIWSYDPDWLMRLKDGIYIKFQLAFFITSLFFYLLFKKNKSNYIFYTRDEYLLKLLQKFSKNVIWEAHTLPKNKSKYLKAWQKCQKIITISQGLKDELVKLGLDENKILVACDGVDLERFETSRLHAGAWSQLKLSENKKIILYSGHLYDWKGVQVLADANKFLDDSILIVFIGGSVPDIEKFKLKNKDKKNILVLGHKPSAEIPDYLKQADVLVLPNLANNEQSKWTSPLKLFEYMASNKPIIASDLPSICEILNENNSILIEPNNSKKLAQAINKILSNSDLAEKISKQASKDVQNYTWQKRAEKILNFIC